MAFHDPVKGSCELAVKLLHRVRAILVSYVSFCAVFVRGANQAETNQKIQDKIQDYHSW